MLLKLKIIQENIEIFIENYVKGFSTFSELSRQPSSRVNQGGKCFPLDVFPGESIGIASRSLLT